MITIGIITRMLSAGGTECVIAQLSKIWKNIGYRVVFLTARPQGNNEFPHACDARQEIDLDAASEDEIRDTMTRHGIHIVVFNDGWNNKRFTRNVEMFYQMGIKSVCINHHAFSNWAFFLNNHEDFFKDAVKGCITALVCVNPVQALWWHHRGFRTVYIPNPVAIQPSVSNTYKHGKTLVWLGRPLDIGKRLPLMLSLFEDIRKRVPGVELIVVGQLTELLRKDLLRNLSTECKDAVTLFGYTSDAAEILAKASVQVITSLLEVTSPQVLLEAAVLGVPTVMFELPVCFDSTRENGVIQVPEGEHQVFVDHVVQLLNDPAYAQNLSERALVWGQSLKYRDLNTPWSELFQTVLDHDEAFFSRNMASVLRAENYALAMREVCRSEHYFVTHYFHILNVYQRMNLWVRCFCKKLHLRWC
jgi:glycosyltransferase involved in cell wall biosynthesis